jgi:hypothetical protein
MLFKTFSRVLVFVSLCVLFVAVASTPARPVRPKVEKRIAHHAATGTKTLKQYVARAPHTRTHPKRQTSPLAGERVITATTTDDSSQDNGDTAAASPSPTGSNRVVELYEMEAGSTTVRSASVSLPTNLFSSRQDDL